MLKKDISAINWSKLSEAIDKEILLKEGITANASWVLPQLMAFLGSNLRLGSRVGDRFSFQEMLRATGKALDDGDITYANARAVTKTDFVGMVRVLTHHPRGEVLGKIPQVKEGIRYSTGVPLVLSALKEFRGIAYKDWDWNEKSYAISFFLDSYTLEAAQVLGSEISFSREDLLSFQTSARTVKTGKTAGEVRKVLSTTVVSKTGNKDFDELPYLTRLAFIQTWVYSPDVRTEYHLYPNFDQAPEAIVTSDVLTNPVETRSWKVEDIPW